MFSFCPSLAVLATTMKLSESVASVTILAFGNGAPDIFTSIRGVDTGETELVYNDIIGKLPSIHIMSQY
jgi:sodium/potassium/calcium exchanger 6